MGCGIRRATRRVRRRAVVCTGLVVALALCSAADMRARAQVVTRGLNIAPVFEGWEQNADGSFNLVFGYFNRNWNEEIDIPVGPNNAIEPGGPDQAQPTHFYPRRSRFVFRVRVPKDFGKKEIVWTLTTNGKTERAYGTLHPDYVINNGIIQANNGESSGMFPNNRAPALNVDGAQTRQAKIGVPITLTAIATDEDGLPTPRPMPRPGAGGAGAGLVQTATGLRFSWFVYRGAGNVTFDPPQFSAWEDNRDGRDSPYSAGWDTPPAPPKNTWVVRATFNEPGTYVLRGLAHDGGLATTRDITFDVGR